MDLKEDVAEPMNPSLYEKIIADREKEAEELNVQKQLEYDLKVPPPIRYIPEEDAKAFEERKAKKLEERQKAREAALAALVPVKSSGYDSENEVDDFEDPENPQIEAKELTSEDLELDEDIAVDALSINFHPTKDWLVASYTNGDVVVYEYRIEPKAETSIVKNFSSHHTDTIRDVCFSDDGNYIFSIGKDKYIKAINCNTWNLDWEVQRAHEHPISKLCVCTDHLLATGDDDGNVKLWKVGETKSGKRKCICLKTFSEHADYISGLDFNADTNTLYASSGDGAMSAYNTKHKKCIDISINNDFDFTCLTECNFGYHVLVGTSHGRLSLFATTKWAVPIKTVATKFDAVDAIAFITENTVAVAENKGYIHVINIPNLTEAGVIGMHRKNASFFQMAVSRDGKLLASSGDDATITFWDISLQSTRKAKHPSTLQEINDEEMELFGTNTFEDEEEDEDDWSEEFSDEEVEEEKVEEEEPDSEEEKKPVVEETKSKVKFGPAKPSRTKLVKEEEKEEEKSQAQPQTKQEEEEEEEVVEDQFLQNERKRLWKTLSGTLPGQKKRKVFTSSHKQFFADLI